jgi:predicted nuclease of predicted toxin-antitoxin system
VNILIDEGVPVQIRRGITGHSATTVQEAGWGSFTNGELLAKAEGSFDVFITADKNLKYQQNLTGRTISILELSTNRRKIIENNFRQILEAVNQLDPGEFISLTID